MKYTFRLYLLIALLAVISGCSKKEAFKPGETYHGFTLVKKQFVEEINAECLLFTHDKSGAQLLKVANDDPNKLFNIAFKTAPENDWGTPHIMEHAVLNGSKNFPVKSPFDVLIQGSLNTFLNAMTGKDITTYPVASMNDKDYFNLMHVYLDAVFNPLIYTDPKILQQEGWHYELGSKDEPLTYKGVVYNEMKGAYSSPQRELYFQIYRNLFPDNAYGFESGGYPTEIPKLTQEYFISFHQKFYHPSNSYILLYGNADLHKELEFIDREYLSGYDALEEKIEIPLQKAFDSIKEIEKTYPVQEGSPVADQTFLSLSFVAGSSTDRDLCMAFDVLSQALVNHESAPLRLALQEAGIGRDVSAEFQEMQQNIFQITVQNANPEDKDRFREIVFKTLQEVAENGLDKTMVEGIINRMEFNLKEGDSAQKGLMCLFMTYQPWFHANDPFAGLEFNKPLAEVKKALNTNLLEVNIQEHLLSNNHALLVVLKPEPGLQAKIEQATNEELNLYKASLNSENLDNIMVQTTQLLEHQQREDTPEALASIPMLELSDIGNEIEWYPIEKKEVAGVPVLHYDEFTNDIVYANLYFDLKALPQELIPYASLLNALLGKMGTENYSFGELDNELNIHTGGFSTFTSTFFENQRDDQFLPRFQVTAKAVTAKTDKMFDLMEEILVRSDFNDTERLKELITRHQSQVDANFKNNGLNYAINRVRSYYSNSGMFNELTDGLEYYRFVSRLAKDFDQNAGEIKSKLAETAGLLFTKNNLVAGVTGSEKEYSTFSDGMQKLAASMPDGEEVKGQWNFELARKNEGLLTASKVQYVIKAYDFKKLGYEYDGKMQVLNQVLSTDWLQNRVRVMGGAYGGFSGISPNGDVYFASYRDPNLSETIDNFNNSPTFLNDFNADEKTMTRFVIGTISRYDQPRNVSDKGNIAFRRYFEKTTPEFLKAEREAILSTTAEDIRSMSGMIEKILSQDYLCVYGNEGKIKENQSKFGSLVMVTE
jgi:presequence protease